MAKHILVTGATGQQGGSVVNALLAKGHRVRGLTRKADSPAAQALASRGVELALGDLTDVDALGNAVEGVDAIFLVTTPFEAGMDVETAQGLAMVEAAKKAGVGHVVFSSVGSADQQTGIPHFESKYKVEQALVASGISHTIMGPVYFMDNVLSPWMLPNLVQGQFGMALPAERTLQQVSVRNIGEFGAALLERGESLNGARFDIAGDELTGVESAQILASASGRPISYQAFPVEGMMEQNEDLGLMFKWFDEVGYSADLARLKTDFPEVQWQTLADWAAEQKWDELLTVAMA